MERLYKGFRSRIFNFHQMSIESCQEVDELPGTRSAAL